MYLITHVHCDEDLALGNEPAFVIIDLQAERSRIERCIEVAQTLA